MPANKVSIPITKEIIIEGLKLFNEKAEILNRRNFTTSVKEPMSFSFGMKTLDDGSTTHHATREGPDEESIHAFVITFRYYIQDNEKCSIRNLSLNYNSGLIDDDLKQQFNEWRDVINTYLDSPLSLNMIMKRDTDVETLTRRRVMDIFVYGGISHANKEKKDAFDFIMSIPFARVALETEFATILELMRQAINAIKVINDKVLEQLK